MEDFFANYRKMLRKNGLKWIITGSHKVVVHHVLFQIKPSNLRKSLESNFALSYHSLRKHIKAFLQHAVKLAQAFELVDSDRL